MKALLREGDIYFSNREGQYFVHKVLRLQETQHPVMHIQTRGPLDQRPEADYFEKYPTYLRHDLVDPLSREEVHYLGNRPVRSAELEPYLHYLKSRDYDAYLKERGQNPDDIYRKAGDAYNLGSAHFEEEQFDKAIKHFDKALKLYPPLYIAHIGRGFCYLAVADLERAWDDLCIAYRHFHDDEDLGRLLVNISLERGMPDLAERYLEELLLSHPDDPELTMYRAYMHLERKNYGSAWDDFRKAQELAPPGDPQYFYNLACYHAARYEPLAALEWLEIALRRGYDDRDYLLFDRHLRPLHLYDEFHQLIEQYLS